MFSQNAIKVLEKRYFLKDGSGKPLEDVEALFKRVASAITKPESALDEEGKKQLADQFFNLMYNGDFLPNSPTLMNAGKANGQLSACFVLPVPDSLEGIFETCKNAALIHKTGGGTGFSFSRLRPYNDPVNSSTGVASGPVSFMCVYDAATEAIRQGGTRRGANIGILRVDHPDIELFIGAKRDTEKLNNFNISVAITDAFMDALKNDGEYELIHPRSSLTIKKVRAREIFDLIVENAHRTGEPGVVFIDRINESDPVNVHIDADGQVVPGTEDIEATNPCGEQPLGPGDACNLGSINVANFVDEQMKTIDWKRLSEVIKLSVRFLDNVIDANHYPLPFIARATLNNRRIGLGIMGWAEALIKLGIAYDSDEAIDQACLFMKQFAKTAHEASCRLAEERGVFPNWPFTSWKERKEKIRNATVTTIAPTGTISIIAGTSSGIEPLFAISFLRRVLGGMELIEVNPLFEKVARERGFYSKELMEQIAQEGTLKDIEGVPDDVKKLFVCSHDIPYTWHVRMQAAFQKHTDNAVSKTINFPASATVDDIKQAYLLAWDLGLKGITVYRDTSRRSQVLNIASTDPLRQSSETFCRVEALSTGLDTEAASVEKRKLEGKKINAGKQRAETDPNIGGDNKADLIAGGEERLRTPGAGADLNRTTTKKQYTRSLVGTVTSPRPAAASARGATSERSFERWPSSPLFYIEIGHAGDDTKLVACDPPPKTEAGSVFGKSAKSYKDHRQSGICPECGFTTGSLINHEACLMCVSCGYTRC